MPSKLAGKQLQHLYCTMSLHIKLAMKTWLMQLFAVTLLKQLKEKLINAHMNSVFMDIFFFFLCLKLKKNDQVLLWKIVSNGNASVFSLPLTLHEYKWVVCFFFFSRYCLRKLLEMLGQMNDECPRSLYQYKRRNNSLQFAFSECITYFNYFKNTRLLLSMQ